MEGQTEQAGAAQTSAAVASGATTGAEQNTQQNTQATQGQQTQTNGSQSIAAGGDVTQQTTQTKPYWPEDWRQRVAEHVGAGDQKAIQRELKRLERFTDPNGIYAMSRELEAKFSSGGLIKKPGKDAKPEEITEYHKALGVPDKAEDYLKDLKLENGAVIGDADKSLVEGVLGVMHEAGAPPAVAHKVLNWYYKTQEAQAAALDEADDKFKIESTLALKEEYGPAYQRMVNSIGSLFVRAPGGSDAQNPGSLFARLMGGRTADGKIIGNDPDMARWLVAIAQDVNPAATVVESGAEGGVTIDNEIKALEDRMRSDRRAYFKDEKAQARYRELITARDKIRARAR